MPATVQLNHLQGDGSTVVPVVTVRFRNDDTSNVDTGSPITLPPDIEATLASVTANSTPQEIAVNMLVGAFSVDDCAIIEPGTNRQEVVQITAVDDTPTITAIFGRSHPAGSLALKVFAAFSKNFQVQLISNPVNSVSNLRFFRFSPLSNGIFDQFRINSSYSPGTPDPWTSDGVNVYGSVPGTPVLLYGTPLLAAGVVPNLLEIQWLYSARAVPAAIVKNRQIEDYLRLIPSTYRICWDES